MILFSHIEDRQKEWKDDENSTWSKARCAQFLQVLAQLAKGDRKTIAGVDVSTFEALYLHGIVWWDEKHKQCILGHSSSFT